MKRVILSGVLNEHSSASCLSKGDTFIDVESRDKYTVNNISRGRDGQFILDTDKGTITLDPSDPVDIVYEESGISEQSNLYCAKFLDKHDQYFFQCFDADSDEDARKIADSICKEHNYDRVIYLNRGK